MKNIDNYLDKLNSTINSLQEEANFYLVIQLFDKLKEFQNILINDGLNPQIILSSQNSLTPGYLIEFDNSNEYMQEIFDRVNIKTAKGINDLEHLLKLPLKFTEGMNLNDFVKNCTTENYQKEFLVHKLETQLPETKHIPKKKL